jgi:pantoate--beta-alanine ligase
MQIFHTIDAVRAYLYSHKIKGRSIGFVPTMGALHAGHLSLVAASKAACDITVCSIFVNPLQFNNPEDLLKYPRTTDADTALLESVGTDVLFLPSVEEMYGSTTMLGMAFGTLDTVMEGACRPGHFSGVGIVVARLFHIIEPHRAFFGNKDFQQLAVIRCMVRDLLFPIEIIGCEILREADGLAMSSRNVRLTAEHRPQAAGIITALRAAGMALREGGISEARIAFDEYLSAYPALKKEYFEIADTSTLETVTALVDKSEVVLCAAVYMDGVRLIDNLVIGL